MSKLGADFNLILFARNNAYGLMLHVQLLAGHDPTRGRTTAWCSAARWLSAISSCRAALDLDGDHQEHHLDQTVMTEESEHALFLGNRYQSSSAELKDFMIRAITMTLSMNKEQIKLRPSAETADQKLIELAKRQKNALQILSALPSRGCKHGR
ncbi:hypothetical protein Ancab_037677 [Ancistrocladus abbreviatus]